VTDKRVIDGVKLPDDGSLTRNEKVWIEIIRLLSNGTDPAPPFGTVQVVRKLLAPRSG
jgi:hypothetical protein